MKSELPKVLHRVCGRSILERVLRAVTELEPELVNIVVGHARELVEAELECLSAGGVFAERKLETVFQEHQLGTADAVKVGLAGISSKYVLIVPGDVPLLSANCLRDFVSAVDQAGMPELAVLTCVHPRPHGFGRIVRGAEGGIEKIVEESDCKESEREIAEINSSVYLVSHDFLVEALENIQPKNSQEEYYLTDIVSYGVTKGIKVMAHVAESYLELSGANTRYELGLLERERRQERNKELMLAGVSFQDPNCTYIDEDVTLEADVYLGAGVSLEGKTSVGTGVRIEGSVTVKSSEIEPGSLIKSGSYIDQAIVGRGSSIGPFAHLRPGSELDEQVKIGNFVETKKAKLARGAKVNHLSYIGDAELGAEVNIGAGTITCNYDGYNKHRTEIGEGAFIGSNTSLVAPLEIGAQAVIGAGSVITKDVPARALGIGRAKQFIKEQWNKK